MCRSAAVQMGCELPYLCMKCAAVRMRAVLSSLLVGVLLSPIAGPGSSATHTMQPVRSLQTT